VSTSQSDSPSVQTTSPIVPTIENDINPSQPSGDGIEMVSITPSKVPTVSPIIANVAGQTIVHTSQPNSPSIEITSPGAQIGLKSKGKYLGVLCLVINLLI